MARRDDDVAAQRRRSEDVSKGAKDVREWAREHKRDEERKRDDERRQRLQERDRAMELESIKLQYMGKKKEKKKIAKPSDKFKFKFDWEAKARTLDPKPLTSSLNPEP